MSIGWLRDHTLYFRSYPFGGSQIIEHDLTFMWHQSCCGYSWVLVGSNFEDLVEG